MHTSLAVRDRNTLGTLQDFLKSLLEKGIVEALLVPMRTPAGGISPALVMDPKLLSEADPFAPVLPVNGATLAGQLSVREPRVKVGVILRSCELRALVELSKVQQANLSSLVTISVDCAGTYSVPNYQRAISSNQKHASNSWQKLFRLATDTPGQPDPSLRSACKICEQPVYEDADIIIELHGTDFEQEIGLTTTDELSAKLGMAPTQGNDRAIVMDKLVKARSALRDSEFAAIRSRLEGAEGINGVFVSCIRCHNCMTVCPICYCKTCVFKSAVFDHEPMQYVNWAKQKGALRMPADTMLFHLTRLNHMVLSCVGCGMCTEACPTELPVGIVFRAIGQRIQSVFEYAPGRNPEEKLPLITFKADEWTEVGE